uniref:NADH-ubiquinone oxidoreductase chain 4 n=1 Tax=Septifer bilocularis TaxID=102393 RepID=A0A516EZK9_9BIVA|nr:NADH dehydrogenase subunit 4 [Septifer bilocularis]QDO71941.1 NADH dehydrogenase subunit 4 [Septifer bilocularis]
MITGACVLLVFIVMLSDSLTMVLLLLCLSVMCFITSVYMQSEVIDYMGIVSLDSTSTSLITLSIFVSVLSMLSSVNVVRAKLFSFIMSMSVLSLVLSFSVGNFFLFFFCFESTLMPILFLIVGWGYQPERLQAGSYMVLYTVFGSYFFLFGISYLAFNGMSGYMFCLTDKCGKIISMVWVIFVVGFLVKLPVYPFHLWLPKAHVEAPVAGSMLLAGVLLKLGGYGLIRFFSVVSCSYNMFSFWFVLVVGLLGGVYCGLMCLRQVDLKCLVAYSSVSHMSLVLLGIMSNTFVGVLGAVVIMIGHGLCSSGLFSMVNLYYLNSKSRLLSMNKGGLIIFPYLSFMCFLLSSSNMAAPPSLNLLGEILVFISCGYVSLIFLIMIGLISFFSACYSLYVYCSCNHGKVGNYPTSWYNVKFLDFFVLFSHWVPLNMLFLFVP